MQRVVIPCVHCACIHSLHMQLVSAPVHAPKAHCKFLNSFIKHASLNSTEGFSAEKISLASKVTRVLLMGGGNLI